MIALRCAAFKVDAHLLLRRPQTLRFRRNASSKPEPPQAPRVPNEGSPPSSPPHIPKEIPVESNAAPIDIPSIMWYHRLGPVTQFFGWFNRTQNKRPYTVQLCTSLITYLCGDLLAQEIGGEKYDPKRTLRMLLIGSISSIPGYRWFLFLGNHFNYPSKVLSIATKVVVQQVFFAPLFNTYFFGMQAVLTGQSPYGVLHRVQQAVPESVLNSAKFWPMVTALSFTFISPQYRFMFSGVFAVIWQTYLSYLNRREEKSIRLVSPVEQLQIIQEQARTQDMSMKAGEDSK